MTFFARIKENLKRITDSTAWKRFRPLVIYLTSILIVAVILWVVISSVINNYLAPVDSNDATPVEFVVESGWGASTIAKHLYEACGEGEEGLISNKAIFKIYVDFTGKSKDLRAGKYYLSKNMDIPTIIDVLCSGNEINEQVVTITIPEGTTIEGIVNILKKNGMNIDEEKFLSLCRSGEAFTSYGFVNNVYIADEDRRYALEGYLFPDTYDFDLTSSSETVITRFLNRFRAICYESDEDYAARAEELGMSMDEVISLAALIEREAVLEEDFYKVSAVFHNRLDRDMKLESDAPLPYILEVENQLLFNEEEKYTDSPYNTHVYAGVPLGPICNPGRLAIRAALYPNEEYMEEEYLFFCLMDSQTGALVYARTNAEHEDNVAKYSENW